MWITASFFSLTRSFIAFSIPDFFKGNALQNKLQLLGTHSNRRRGTTEGKFKGSFLKSFVIDRKAIALPQQQLEFIALSVDENENSTVQHIHLQMRSNQATQAVKAFTHVGGAAIQIVLAQVGKV